MSPRNEAGESEHHTYWVAFVLSALQWKPGSWLSARQEACYLETSWAAESWLALYQQASDLLTQINGMTAFQPPGSYWKMLTVCVSVCVCVCFVTERSSGVCEVDGEWDGGHRWAELHQRTSQSDPLRCPLWTGNTHILDLKWQHMKCGIIPLFSVSFYQLHVSNQGVKQ